MSPSILIAGATGNTGRSLTEILPELLKASKTLSSCRVIALTRSLASPAAQQLAKIPGVEFTEESSFHTAALRAGVKYVVRISTVGENVRPDCDVYYPLDVAPAECFFPFYLDNAADFIKKYRKTATQEPLSLLAAEDAPVGIIDPAEVGVFAAHLLALDDFSPHDKAKYILNGPEDITRRQIVGLIEGYIGTKVENVIYRDMSFVDAWAPVGQPGRNITLTVKHSLLPAHEGKLTASTTSKEVLEIAAPKRTPADVLKYLLEE
ncbi:hypothetical protein BDV12DRAFT_200665 [Aspergillus spectabilis]